MRLPSADAMTAWFRRLDSANPIVRLDRGQFDLGPPTELVAEALRELGPRVYWYDRGSTQLKAALQEDLERRRNLHATPDELLVTHGAIAAIAATFRALCRCGDTVLLPLPVWPTIVDLVRLAGAEAMFYPCFEDCHLDALPAWIDRTASARTRVLFLNLPHNPTGLWASSTQAEAIMTAARRNGLLVVADEAYEGLTPRGQLGGVVCGAVPGAADAVLVLSMSKRFAAPGLRVGFVRAPASLAAAIGRAANLHTGGLSELSRQIALQLLRGGADFTGGIRDECANRRRVAEATLREDGFSCAADRAGMYVLCNAPAGWSGWRVASVALRRHLGIVPGEIFGCPNTFRVTLAVPGPQLRQALAGLGAAVRRARAGGRRSAASLELLGV